ncbi:MAG TPA: response regulator [Thermoanaerobaculia bacterium]|nr:response regulator [Thermoanaerobaculia bacterium]
MITTDLEFRALLQSTFKVEADEHMQVISNGLLELEKTSGGNSQSIIETVFRATHTLKGAARAVDLTEIESLCQPMEDTLASWKRQESAPSRGALDLLHRALDSIATILTGASNANGSRSARPSPHRLENSPASVPARVTSASPSLQRPAPVRTTPMSVPPQGKAVAEETVRISLAKLEARLLESEEMLNAKLTAGQRAADLRELGGRVEELRRTWAAAEPDVRGLRQPRGQVFVGVERASCPELVRLLDVFDSSLDTLKALESTVAALGRTAEQDRYAVGKLVDDLLEDSKKLLLLPFATISTSFPKIVRDLCRDQGKEADFTIRGEEVEIDKRILEEMKDPIVHLLRNSIDHGIETPEERTRRGKPARATITLVVSQVNGSKAQLLLSDDGAGIDSGKVKESAVRQELISAEEAGRLDETEAQRLIFRSLLSTSPIITELSGRGLGLAIVQEKVEKMGGRVSVESRLGAGTAFCIVIPSTRATFRGVLVEAVGQLLVVPTAQVERVGRAVAGDLQTVEGHDTISFDGRTLPLVRLADALELPSAEGPTPSAAGTPFLVLGSGDARVAFAVDAVRDEQEVLVKPLRKPLSRVRNVAGVTVLGSGRVAAILNVSDLLRSARRTAGAEAQRTSAPKPSAVKARSILVAEDSITSRMLLKSILESAGYKVRTAVDGMEAFTLLRAEAFDLIVSDVEMPRLNGFDLTARIRADGKLADLPVVLVTALETREDRERGIDAGANAYIVKGSFDQSNLLEAVRRLI